jgi:hypothetical protein
MRYDGLRLVRLSTRQPWRNRIRHLGFARFGNGGPDIPGAPPRGGGGGGGGGGGAGRGGGGAGAGPRRGGGRRGAAADRAAVEEAKLFTCQRTRWTVSTVVASGNIHYRPEYSSRRVLKRRRWAKVAWGGAARK